VVRVLIAGAGVVVAAVAAWLAVFVCVVNTFPLPEEF
jgi:hypothetical protein